MILNSLNAFSSFLQLCLFIYLFLFISDITPNLNLPIRILLLILFFIIFFNFFLYTIAFIYKEKLLKNLIYLYRLPWIFFYPINTLLSILIRRAPENKEDQQDNLSDRELEVFFEESTKDGVLEKEDKEMIESVIEFGDTLVKDIMTPRVDMIYVSIDTNINELTDIINKNKKSRYPVIYGRIDNIEGVILSKDVFNYLGKNDFNIKKIIRNAIFISETMRIIQLLKKLQKAKQKFAVVVDEFGGISGVVTMEDIIEEIVGEIQDEYDDDGEQIKKEKNYFIVNGKTDIYELADELSIAMEDEQDFQTVAGLIAYKLGKIPKINDTIIIDPYTFKVLDTDKNRIKKVKIYIE